jgi:hypothetical protein
MPGGNLDWIAEPTLPGRAYSIQRLLPAWQWIRKTYPQISPEFLSGNPERIFRHDLLLPIKPTTSTGWNARSISLTSDSTKTASSNRALRISIRKELSLQGGTSHAGGDGAICTMAMEIFVGPHPKARWDRKDIGSVSG